jgi:hypothetical protein
VSEMIEKVARAIQAKCRERGLRPIPDYGVHHLAAAAIEAMREPSDEMLAATVPFPDHLVRERNSPDYEKHMAAATLADRMGVRQDWQDMIDAALTPQNSPAE